MRFAFSLTHYHISRGITLCVLIVGAVVVMARVRLLLPEVTQATITPVTVNESVALNGAGQTPSATERKTLSRAADVLPETTELPDAVAQSIGAKQFIVMDSRSGRVFADRRANEAYPMASLTKLLASLVIIDNVTDWKELVEILPGDIREGESVVKVGERLELYDLFAVTLIRSSNTGIMALARAVGLSAEQLVERMNGMAEQHGWTTIMVTDPTGLLPTTVGSAHDVARILAQALGRNEIANVLGSSQYAWPIYSAEHTVLSKRSTISTNQLIHPNIKNGAYTVVGGKTGYIPESGYNVSVEAVNVQQYRLITVVMGASTFERRFDEADRLLRWAFSLLPIVPQSL